jgi:hypothetical protein
LNCHSVIYPRQSRFRKHVVTKTALILDEDLACLFALSSALVELCYSSIPAHTVQEAKALIVEMGATVDLLLVNVAVPHAQPFSLELQVKNPALMTIQLTASSGEFEIPRASTSRILQKPDSTQAASYWIDALRNALGGHESAKR